MSHFATLRSDELGVRCGDHRIGIAGTGLAVSTGMKRITHRRVRVRPTTAPSGQADTPNVNTMRVEWLLAQAELDAIRLSQDTQHER